MKVYKIRNRVTGEFTRGGLIPDKNTNVFGKVWSRIGLLRQHLSQFPSSLFKLYRYSYDGYMHPEDWEVVEYKMVESKVTPLVDFK